MHDPIQGHGHVALKVWNFAIFKIYLLCHFQWELTSDCLLITLIGLFHFLRWPKWTVACSRTAAEVGSLFPSCHLAVAVAARQRLTRTACIKSLLCDFLGTILASYRSVLTDGEPARRRHSAWSESTRATPWPPVRGPQLPTVYCTFSQGRWNDTNYAQQLVHRKPSICERNLNFFTFVGVCTKT